VEALGGADRGERLVGLVGLDVRHYLASHRVLVPRRRLENCGESVAGVRFKPGLGPTRRGRKEGRALDLGPRP
jgi:hypothetical protein